MKDLSIIIVNYNVKHFLEHCLLSVFRAVRNIQAEIFVVDNHSADGSIEMVQRKFPGVHLISNKENAGFAKANNQAFALSTGKYILYLNPDTILPEDCFDQCFAFMEAHKDIGALGPRLIDGKGLFLPESKRGFPGAWVAFCKISGLSSLFKTSNLFNRYHMGYLPEKEIADVDILVGCFMFCRKSVLDQTGSFDERYFMYGEDIDLSFQIKKAGFRNIYFPDTTVIHFKGESTKKGSLNYVRMFYKAMIQFAKKNFTGSGKSIYILLLTLAIYFRAIVALFQRIFSIISLPVIDSFLLAISLWSMKFIWERNVKPDTVYSDKILLLFFGIYILIWIFSIFFSGGYDKPYKWQRVLRGMFLGSAFILVVYALLPEKTRFSRGITVFSAVFGTLCILLVRRIMQWIGVKNVISDKQLNKNIILIADETDEMEIRNLITHSDSVKKIIGSISPTDSKQNSQLGIFKDFAPLAKLYQAGEIVFSQKNLGFKEIIRSIQEGGQHLNYKIHAAGTDSIIGSNSKNTAGDLYSREEKYNIRTPENKRYKRTVDILFSFFFILASPLLIWLVENKRHYFPFCFLILKGDKTFVGYDDDRFPKLKPHIFPAYTVPKGYRVPFENMEHLNWLYARNYSPWTDVRIIWENWRKL